MLQCLRPLEIERLLLWRTEVAGMNFTVEFKELGSMTFGLQPAEARVSNYGEEPWTARPSPKTGEGPPGSEVRLLNHVFRVLLIAEQ